MTPDTQTSTSYPSPIIRRGAVECLDLYEVTDHELGVLEQGSPATLFLNFSIFLFSCGLTFLVTITTTKIDSVQLYLTYTSCAIIGIMGGILLFSLWLRTRKSVKTLCIKIRNRIVVPIIANSEETAAAISTEVTIDSLNV